MKTFATITGALAVLVLAFPALYASYESVHTPEDTVLSKGFAAFMDGRDKQALSYFEEVMRLNPHNKAAQTGLEKVKIRLKKMEDIQKARAHELAKAKLKEGRKLLETGDVVGAIDSFHDALDAVPDFSAATKEIKRIKEKTGKSLERRTFQVTAWTFSRGVLAYLERDWAKAYRVWSERLRVEPQNVALANATARAENKFERMMMTEQEDFYRRGARAFYEQGLYGQAKASWQKVLAMRTDDQEGLEGLARSEDAILRAQGKNRNSEVEDLLEQGLDYYAGENWFKARETFQRIALLDPDFGTAKEYITIINRRMNESTYTPTGSSTEKSWRMSKPSNEGNEAVKVSSKLENYQEAKKELESQLKRDPGNIRIQQQLDAVTQKQDEESERIYKDGLIAYSQGNRDLAIQQWKQVLVINPDHKKAAAALRKAKAEEERSAPTP